MTAAPAPLAPVSPPSRAPRDPRRYRKLRRFVLRTFLHAFWWDVVLALPGLGRLRRPARERWRRIAHRYRSLAAEMGGVLIKIGQFLSTRVDLLPAEIVAELAGLQDEVPPAPFPAIERAIAEEFGARSPFAEVSPVVLGAASLAQVHPARLLDGREVVVKVLRPGIDVLVETDLSALSLAVRLLSVSRKIRRRVDLPRLAQEIATTTLAELDLEAEAGNAERFAELFADEPGISVPRIHREASGRRVLTAENVAAWKINDVPGLVAAGIDPRAVARRLYRAYMRQIFEFWFVHADPHPGNLFVQPLDETPAARNPEGVESGDGRPFRIVFVDFGMMATIPGHLREALREYAIALGTRDAARMVQAYVAAGVLLPDADLDRLEEVHAELFARFWGVAVGKMRDVALAEARYFLRKYRDLLYEMPFQIQVDLLFVSRAIGLLAGLTTSLDPDFDPWAATLPFAERLAKAELARDFGERLADGWDQLRAAAGLPRRLDALLARAERGALKVRMEPGREARRSVQRLERALAKLAWAVLSGAFAVAGAILAAAGSPWAWVAAGLAGAFALRFVLARNL
ncbi:MAG TPA: AarF/UbiB family protein [Thermoanaerobaculia bacterium]|nr:AarF/UbiB family protein [Thermoanaerobaculia bacterium]